MSTGDKNSCPPFCCAREKQVTLHVQVHWDVHSRGEHKTTDTHLEHNPVVYRDTLHGLTVVSLSKSRGQISKRAILQMLFDYITVDDSTKVSYI